MSKYLHVIWIILLAIFTWPGFTYAAPDVDLGALQMYVEVRLTADAQINASRLPALRYKQLEPFYRQRQYTPMWIDESGVRPAARQLFSTIRRSNIQGLSPDDYHVRWIAYLLSNRNPAYMADLEVVLSDAFLRYCSDIRTGRPGLFTADPNAHPMANRIDYLSTLEEALNNNQIDRLLATLHPHDPHYNRMQTALNRYRKIAAQGGWPTLPATETIYPRSTGPKIATLKKRLTLTADLDPALSGGDIFDTDVENAVKRFQRRHGLSEDGKVGPQTLAALNTPVDEKIDRLIVNLERRRGIPLKNNQRYLLVNMARFTLEAIEEGETVFSMRVIVGKSYRKTPVFSAELKSIILNPYWYIPPTIVLNDMLPRLTTEPDYFQRNNIGIYRGWNDDTLPVDPLTIDWSQYNRDYFPFTFRQDYGPRNALGHIKFIMPNEFSVYLHDTPHRELFKHNRRTFSSGCIRLEKPFELAAYLLKGHNGWNSKTLQDTVADERQVIIGVKDPLPVHLVYWTSWVDENDAVHFREDIYARDRLLTSGLTTKTGRNL